MVEGRVRRSGRFLAILCAIWCGWTLVDASLPSLYAQDPAPAAADAPPPADGAPPAKAEQSMLSWLIETSGWIGLVILLLSIYFVAKVTSLFVELRYEQSAPPEITAQCDTLAKSKDAMGIYNVVRQDDSFYSTVVAAGLVELPNGLTEARDAMERTGDTLVVHMEKNISMLAVIGTLGPMIGLLGTLKGMISSFSVIARTGTQLDASEVAKGISEALVLTFEGVGLSVPAIYFFALFRNRVASISSATMLAADELIRRVHAGAKGKPVVKPVGAKPPAEPSV